MNSFIDRDAVKCPTCKRKIHHMNQEGRFVTKNCSVIESDPRTGRTFAICKFCKSKVMLGNLRLVIRRIPLEAAV